MEWLNSNIIEGYLIEGHNLKYVLNTTVIRAGMYIEVYDKCNERWIYGKVKYLNGYCIFSEEYGYIYFYNGMSARKMMYI